MEVDQWINMIIKVIQFPSVLSFSNFICPQLFILFIVQTAN